MATEPHFHLTTRDHAILHSMLERSGTSRDPFTHLLERKTRDSTIYLRDDIPPNVVTLNTRFIHSVNGLTRGPRLLVPSESDTLPDYALSIHTLRGLALLGVTQGDTIIVHAGAGIMEELRIEAILFQPEADNGASAEHTGNVVSFMHRPRSPAPRDSPHDDDPGPTAA